MRFRDRTIEIPTTQPVDMGRVYLVRHGATPWTEQDRVQGWAPVGLSATGRQQIAAVASQLSEKLSDRPVVVSSDLERAAQSAQIITSHCSSATEMTVDRRLRERDFGVFQGLDDPTYHELRAQELGKEQYDRLTWAPENGESWHEVRSRVSEAWHTYTRDEADTRPIIVVSHFGPIHCILSAVTGRTLTAEFDIGHSTGGVSAIRIGQEQAELVDRDMQLSVE